MDLGSLYAKAITGVTTLSSVADLALVTVSTDLGIHPAYVGANYAYAKKGFLFHIKGEESVTLQNDITDHFVEDNTALQDHIALRPETITLSGFIGELNNVTPVELELVKAVVDRLASLDTYQPTLSIAALRNYNAADQLYRVAAKVKQAFKKLVTGSGEQSLQSKTFQMFYDYRQNRQLFYVQTPWRMFESMAILSMRSIQSEGDKNSSEFEITFKRIRTAETELTTQTSQARGGGTVVNKGKQSI